MLIDRLKTSSVLISVVLVLLYLDANHSVSGAEGLWLIPLLLFFAFGTAFDMASLFASSGRPISRFCAVAGAGTVTLSACVPWLWPLFGSQYPPNCPVGRLGWIVIAAVAVVFVILLVEMNRYARQMRVAAGPDATTANRAELRSGDDPSGHTSDHDLVGTGGGKMDRATSDKPVGRKSGAVERTSGACFVSLYVGLPMALMAVLRSAGQGNWGLAALVTMIAVTKSADAGAYFAGKSLGRHKLVPRLSPGKTWEGAVGGVLASTIVAYVLLAWFFPWLVGQGAGPVDDPVFGILSSPIWGAVVLGPVLMLAGLVGDLAESLIKRDCGAKDSGHWLPGLGGVWDVTDSLIAAVMPAFLCFIAGVAS